VTIPLIDTGMIRRHEASSCPTAGEAEYSRFDMKFLKSGSLPDLMNLQSIIAANLPCPEIFMLHEEKFFQEIFRLERSIIGVTADEELIAFSIIRIPGLADDSLGKDLNLRDEELIKVAHLQAAAVHPAYRGNGLQRKLTSVHLRVIKEMGYEHVCCTVSPKNPVSLANYLSCGLAIEGLRPKMLGWWRYILHKSILHPDYMDLEGSVDKDESAARRIEIKMQISDIEGQLDLLKRGFKGFRIAFLPEGAEIFYA
jgi:ribosomal protein S18 acetylase RimI-like enzyme